MQAPTNTGCECNADRLSVLETRWTLRILLALLSGPMRFTDLRTEIPAISAKTLSIRLRELEAAQLITHGPLSSSSAVPAYTLAPSGTSLRPMLVRLLEWANNLKRDEL